MEENLAKSFAEVDKILSLMEDKYVQKIPRKMREMFKTEKQKEYKPNIDANMPLNEQNLQRKTLAILAMLNLNYWCETEEEKQELLKVYAENDKKKEQEIRDKYNPDNLFKKKEKIVEEKAEHTELIEYNGVKIDFGHESVEMI